MTFILPLEGRINWRHNCLSSSSKKTNLCKRQKNKALAWTIIIAFVSNWYRFSLLLNLNLVSRYFYNLVVDEETRGLVFKAEDSRREVMCSNHSLSTKWDQCPPKRQYISIQIDSVKVLFSETIPTPIKMFHFHHVLNFYFLKRFRKLFRFRSSSCFPTTCTTSFATPTSGESRSTSPGSLLSRFIDFHLLLQLFVTLIGFSWLLLH